ncbi:MAG: CHAT domain-containing protein [Cyanobacteria bacterium J06598_1]
MAADDFPLLASVNQNLTKQNLTKLALTNQALTNHELIEQGRHNYLSQRFTAAVNDWSQAEAILAAQNNFAQQALLLSYLTAAYQQLGQWEQAEQCISQSLEIISEVSVAPQISAQVYNTFGSLQFATGNVSSALERWQQAAAIYLNSGDEQRYFNNLLNQVQALQTLGYYHQVAGKLHVLEEALPQQAWRVQARGYQQLGKTYRLLGNLEASKNALETALSLSEDFSQQQTQGNQTQDSQTAEEHIDTGAILIELGNTAQAKGELPEAIALYQQAITASLTTPETNGTPLDAKLNLFKMLVETDPIAARQMVSMLETDLTHAPLGRAQIYAYIQAAQSLLALEDSTESATAASWLAQALQQSIDLQDRRAQSYAQGYLAQAYERSHQWPAAKQLTEAALTTAQTINAADIAYQWQWQLGRLLKQQNKPEEALQAYRTAFASLQSIHQDLSATHQDLQFSFRDSVEPIYRELVDLLLRPSPDPSHQEARRQEARTVIESLQVAELDNFFRTACLDAQKVALEDVAKTDAAVVYPIILSDRIEILVSLPGQPLQQFTTPISPSELAQTIADWRRTLEKPFTAPEGKVLGQTLYQWLIEPMQSALVKADVKTLAFVLEGELRNVPLAALYDGAHYLIEDYEIVLSPGLQLLGPRALQDTRSTALLAGLTQPRHGFSALSHVETELQTAHGLINSRLLLNEDFTTQRLAQQISGSNQPIVHLATHGQFSSNLDETFILAWDRPIQVVEMSALLKAGDLNRRDPIELLILSACETAAGDARAALGLAGVALQSGTRSTLASLWTIDDASSAFFIDQFYQHLNQPHTSKADALRQSQLALLQNPDYRHPRYWSAYVLVGNWL